MTRAVSITIADATTGIGPKWADLYIEATVELTSAAAPNSAKVKVHNLSDQYVAFAEKPNRILQVSAGDPVTSSLFIGDILRKQVKTYRKGPDLVTEINAMDCGRRWLDAQFAKSYPANTSRNVIIQDIVAALRLPIGYLSPTLEPVVYPTGYSFVGPAHRALADVLAQDLSRFVLQHGAVYILSVEDTALPGNAILVSEETGLMESPTKTNNGGTLGVDVKVRLNPAFSRVYIPFVVKSRFVNGLFRATKIQHEIKTDGSAWETKVSGLAVK